MPIKLTTTTKDGGERKNRKRKKSISGRPALGVLGVGQLRGRGGCSYCCGSSRTSQRSLGSTMIWAGSQQWGGHCFLLQLLRSTTGRSDMGAPANSTEECRGGSKSPFWCPKEQVNPFQAPGTPQRDMKPVHERSQECLPPCDQRGFGENHHLLN